MQKYLFIMVFQRFRLTEAASQNMLPWSQRQGIESKVNIRVSAQKCQTVLFWVKKATWLLLVFVGKSKITCARKEKSSTEWEELTHKSHKGKILYWYLWNKIVYIGIFKTETIGQCFHCCLCLFLVKYLHFLLCFLKYSNISI